MIILILICAALLVSKLIPPIAWLWRYLPGNLLRAWLLTRRGLKWGVPAMLLAIPYYFLGRWLLDQVLAGEIHIAWSILAAGLGLSSALFMVHGPRTLWHLAHYRLWEYLEKRRLAKEEAAHEAEEAELEAAPQPA